MKETIQRYLEIFEEFLQGKRDYYTIPTELKRAFEKNSHGSYHWLCGIKTRINPTEWDQIVALQKHDRDGGSDDFLRLEGPVADQEVILRYYTRSRGEQSSWGCSGTINGQEISSVAARRMAENFLRIRNIQHALNELPNAFSKIETEKERAKVIHRNENLAVQPLAHLLCL